MPSGQLDLQTAAVQDCISSLLSRPLILIFEHSQRPETPDGWENDIHYLLFKGTVVLREL